MLGAALELYGAHRVETTKGLLSEPYTQGRPGRLLRAGRALTAAGVAGAVLGPAQPGGVRRCPALSLLAASVLTRFGIFEGGMASAQGPEVHGACRSASGSTTGVDDRRGGNSGPARSPWRGGRDGGVEQHPAQP